MGVGRCSSHVDSGCGYRRELGVPATVGRRAGMSQLKQEWCLHAVSHCSAVTLHGFDDTLVRKFFFS